MPWTKFPNQMNDLLTLRRALQIAANLTAEERGNDEKFGYALLQNNVITSRKSIDELQKLPRQNQGPITVGRGLPQMFVLLGLMVRADDAILISESGLKIVEQQGDAVTDEEIDVWRTAILELGYDHETISMRPAYVVLKMLLPGDLRAQSLALAFSASSESEREISRIRSMAETWGSIPIEEIASAIGTTKSEISNNAKVFPGLMEQCGLIRRRKGIARISELGLSTLNSDQERESIGPATLRKTPDSRPITQRELISWVPNPVDPNDAAEQRLLRLIRAERANAGHERVLQIVAATLSSLGFDVSESHYDILAKRHDLWLLIEVKSLSANNVRRQTITALGQLAFYYHDIARDIPDNVPVHRIIAYERPIDDDRVLSVLAQENVSASWVIDDAYFIEDQNIKWILQEPI